MTSSKLEVLTPANCQIIFIDHQPQMAFGVQSIDRQVLKNNTVALAKAAKVFNIPTIITTVETESFSGNTYPELLDVFPGQDILERTSMNSWDDQKVRDALKANGKVYEAFIYENTEHGFHNDSTPRYDEAAAELAWQRTIDWFNKYLA